MLQYPITQRCSKFSGQGDYGTPEERDKRTIVYLRRVREKTLRFSKKANWSGNDYDSSQKLTLTIVLQSTVHGSKVNPEGI